MPMNAKMAELKRCFERAGFTDVKTVLSSGNVAFDARAASPAALERRIGRSSDALRKLVESDPYRKFRLPAKAKRVVTFLRSRRKSKLGLPLELDGAKILTMKGGEAFTAYARGTR